jgi:SagB-type dehydrogenase family enzyme
MTGWLADFDLSHQGAAAGQVYVRLIAGAQFAVVDTDLAIVMGPQRLKLVAALEPLSEDLQALGAGVSLARLAALMQRAQELGLGVAAHRVIEALCSRGLVEYDLADGPLGRLRIVPTMARFRLSCPPLAPDLPIILSRFALLRRQFGAMVLESPLAGAVVHLGPEAAALLARLAIPQPLRQLQEADGTLGQTALRLLLGLGMVEPAQPAGPDLLATWDFHDLLFHARSQSGRHANPVGAQFGHLGRLPPAPVSRPPPPTLPIDLIYPPGPPPLGVLAAIDGRRSVRAFNADAPMTLDDLGRFLFHTARATDLTQATHRGRTLPDYRLSRRPYPSGGASYEFELYPCVFACRGLAKGLYFYDAPSHRLHPMPATAADLAGIATRIQSSLGRAALPAAVPNVALLITARFARVGWKYRSIAYATTLKNLGALYQTFYLAGEALGLGGCALGNQDLDLFETILDQPFHQEGLVGQFALGRPA